MYKLPISKYKNVTPKLVKKEQCVSGVSTNRLLNTIGNLVNCNLNYVSFAYDTTSGGQFCTLTHNDLLRKTTFNSDTYTTTHAHTGPLTDLQYNPFDTSILATCAYDSQINLWSVNSDENEAKVQVSQQDSLLNSESRCDSIQWNLNAENILASVSLSSLYLWDVEHKSIVNSFRGHTDAIQSISWKRDGSMLVTTSKDKTMQIFDPRNSNEENSLKVESTKTNNKDSKVVWINNSNFILSSVYTMSHQRELYLWDIRNTSAPVAENTVDMGNNVITPLYDADTGILFLSGKAESTIRYGEVMIDNPNIVINSVQPLDDQVKSLSMVPKLSLDLMKCEIDRLILLTRNSVYPLPYHVPRRSYYDFHSDVFPETYLYTTDVSKDEWLEGQNGQLSKVQLNPNTQKVYNPSLNGLSSAAKEAGNNSNAPVTAPTLVPTPTETSKPFPKVEPVKTPSPEPVRQSPTQVILNSVSNGSNGKHDVNEEPRKTPSPINDTVAPESTNGTSEEKSAAFVRPASPPKVQLRQKDTNTQASVTPRTKAKSVYYQSKFKYINGKIAHKSEHITNLRNLSTMWPGECNGFQVNSKHAAFLLAGQSGQIGIVELNKPGRLADSVINSIVNKSKVSDFSWDPYDDEVLAAACDDGVIKVWRIPEDGLQCALEEPDVQLRGHTERLYCIKFHPYAKDVLASASYDRTVRLWNIDNQQCEKVLSGHNDAVMSMSWSPCGTKLATIAKDGFVRVFEPLQSESPVLEAKVGPPSGSKAARIEWAVEGKFLLISGFGKSNSRHLYLLNSADLELLQTEDLSQSPSLLIPFYDSDINVVFLFAKGEENINLYEIQDTEPYFQVLTPYRPDGSHFALGFLPKQQCDVKSVEIAKAYRLTKDNRIESISFTVPRVKQTLFQDDLFPSTVDRLKPYLKAAEWFQSTPFELNYVDLRPQDMQKLTDVQAQEQDSNSNKKENTNGIVQQTKQVKPRAVLDENGFGEEERKIINTMLQRATLYKSKDDTDEEDNSDWDQ